MQHAAPHAVPVLPPAIYGRDAGAARGHCSQSSGTQQTVTLADKPEDLRQTFDQAVRAFAGRTDVLKKSDFLKLEEQNRARSWTVARVNDLEVLQDLHEAAQDFTGTGDTFRDFVDRLDDIMAERGWGGLEPWHARLVYDQNVGMAYTAGRFQQAQRAGIGHWRYLPSDAQTPRVEHEKYYNQIFPLGEGPMPPLDFGCSCGWEVVFEDELDGADVQSAPPRVSREQEFQFSPASFFRPLEIDPHKYAPRLVEALRRAAQDDPLLKVSVSP